MRIYLSGPMKGIKHLNRPCFNAVAEMLSSLGHEPVMPHEIMPDVEGVPEEKHYVGKDIEELSKCDMICMLPGWPNSRGARMELYFAIEYGIPIYQNDTAQIELIQNAIFKYKNQ